MPAAGRPAAHARAIREPGRVAKTLDLGPPRVVGLFLASAAGEPMIAPAAVELVTGVGIVGDRYATRRGHWSDPGWRDQQLTLVSQELLDELGLASDALRRNFVTEGLDLHNLIGLEFGIGEAVLRGQRICTPCGYIGCLNRRPSLFAELNGRRGIRVSVVRGGQSASATRSRSLGWGTRSLRTDGGRVHGLPRGWMVHVSAGAAAE